MRIIPIPIFENNYSYLIVDDKANEAAAVDPADPQKVLSILGQTGAKLTSILTTHHHQKHANGNIELVHTKPNLAVYGADARIPELNYVCKHQEEFTVGTLKVRSLHTPCHTKGHVCYYVRDGNEMIEEKEKAVFTGDTLLIGGCGKFLEGESKDMYNALYHVLCGLPKDTQIYCGHEHAAKNLEFASRVDPNNPKLLKKLRWSQVNQVTVPSTLEEELEYNPFLRVSDPAIQQATNSTDPFEVLKTLRAWADNETPNDSLNGTLNNGSLNSSPLNGSLNGTLNGSLNGHMSRTPMSGLLNSSLLNRPLNGL